MLYISFNGSIKEVRVKVPYPTFFKTQFFVHGSSATLVLTRSFDVSLVLDSAPLSLPLYKIVNYPLYNVTNSYPLHRKYVFLK